MAWQSINFPGFGIDDNRMSVAMTFFQMDLYVAVTNTESSRAEIWRCHPSVLMSPTFIKSSWQRIAILPDSRRIDHMIGYRDKLIVPNEQSRLLTVRWSGRSSEIESPSSLRFGISSMIEFENSLFIVFNGRPFEIWRSRNTSLTDWELVSTEIVEGTGGSNFSGTLFKISDGDNDYLFLGTGIETPGRGGLCQIWRTENGSNWEKWVDNSFGDSGNGAIASLDHFEGDLYVSTINHISGSKLYVVDIHSHETFEEVTIPNTAPIRSMANWNNTLYAGEGNNLTQAGLFYKSLSDNFVFDPFDFAQELVMGDAVTISHPQFLIPLKAMPSFPIRSLFIASWSYVPTGGVIIWRQIETGRRYVSDWIFELTPILWAFRNIPFVPPIFSAFLSVFEFFFPKRMISRNQ